ncbi:MAG: peptidoglycan-binding domain-containing protein [Pseudomonadota bacterium]
MLRYGSRGSKVVVCQSILNSVFDAAPPLVVDGVFGALTHRRVQAFQGISPNRLAADGIVGPMTAAKMMRFLDAPDLQTSRVMAEARGPVTALSGFYQGVGNIAGGGGGATKPKPRIVILCANEPDYFAWAKRVHSVWKQIGDLTRLHMMNPIETVDSACRKMERAAAAAGPGGTVILSVGHGACRLQGNLTNVGGFDMAPKGCVVIGANEDHRLRTKTAQVSVFYDVKLTKFSVTMKKQDETLAQGSDAKAAAARERLRDFQRFIDMGKALEKSGIAGIFMLTCRVGLASDFMRMTRKKMRVPLSAYTRSVACSQVPAGGLERTYLMNDQPGRGTNRPMHAILPPVLGLKARDLVHFQ